MGEENKVISGKAFFFCHTKDIGTENEKWMPAEIKEMDSLKIREKTDVPEVDWNWNKTSFECSCTIEPSRELNRLMGRYRKNRHCSRTFIAKAHRVRYYLCKAGRIKSLKPKYSLSQIRAMNETNRMFRKL